MTFFLLKVLLMNVLPFYRVDFPLDKLPDELSYTDYIDGKVQGPSSIKKGEQSYALLKRIFIEEQGGWKYDINTYSDARIFTSKTMKINCLKRTIIVNYQNQEGTDGWVQISKDVHAECPVITE